MRSTLSAASALTLLLVAAAAVVFPPSSLLARSLFAGGLVLLSSGAFILARRMQAARIREAALFVSQLPALPSAMPAVAQTLLPLQSAGREVAERIGRQLASLEESRNRLEVLLEGMQDAVLGVDAAGRVLWSNAHMQRLMSREAGGASIRQGRALVHTFRDPALLASVQSALDEGKPAECRSEAVLPGRVFQVHASPLPGGGAVVVLHDHTRAEQAEREQRDFVANVSHELRTPLTSIIGYVETVLDHETLSASSVEFLETVLKNASRMQRLTEDLLLLSQVERAEKPMFPQPVAARSLLQDAVRTVSGASYAEGAELKIERCDDVFVMADENATLQVLGNLLENAVKYSRTATGAPRVWLAAELSPDEPGTMRFSVRDFGSGIASEHLPRIFERFYRVEKARSRAVGGTGLGLSIARELVQQHHGRIWVESTMGEGSTFLFTLPLAN